MGQLFYLNGKFLPEEEAKISVTDLGFVRGFGVFDFLRTYKGKPFKLDAHLKRLKNSAGQIELKCPPLTQVKEIVLETLRKNHLPEANVKIILSGGITPDQITPSENPTLAVLVYPPTIYPRDFYENGIKIVTVPITRAFPTSKTINYIPAIIALAKAKKARATEAIYRNERNEVLEGTTTNFFIFKGSTLITPTEGILSGITREVVLELAKKEFKVNLRPVKYSELKKADEAFITASNKEIMPVVKIDDIKVGNGKVGKNTKRLMALFKEYTEA